MDSPVALKCPNCGSVLRSTDLDLEHGVVKCSYCHALSTLPSKMAPDSSNGFRERPEVPLPPKVTCVDNGYETVITRSWFSHAVWFLLFFCVIWNPFLVFWYTMAFASNAPFIFKVFPILHVAVGLSLSYTVLTMFFNSTVIIAGPQRFRIHHGPLPAFGNVQLEAADLVQLYGKEKISHSRKHGTSISYELWAKMRDGTAKKLVGGLNDDQQALFLEQRLEKAMGIQDRTMPGELAR